MMTTVQPLKKVRLSMNIDESSTSARPEDSRPEMEFIHGIASDGLSPFETELGGKRKGDRLSVNMAASAGAAYFGHLFFPLRQALGLRVLPPALDLEFTVVSVDDADQREIVRSMAKSLSHDDGCGGSCGCGCGG